MPIADQQHVGVGRAALYASVNVPLMMMQAPATIILPSLYVQFAGLDIVVVGVLMTLLRFCDALLDPAIGYLSDRTRSRLGRRRTWIVAGSVLSIPAILLAFRPGPETGYVYFTLSYFLLTLSWTLCEIPHTAWLGEITQDYAGRNRLSTYRYIAGMGGTALFPLISFLPWLPSRAITPQVTQLAGIAVIALLAITVPITLRLIPDPPNANHPHANDNIRRTFHDLWRNRPLRLFVAMQGLTGLASGMVMGLYYFYISSYLRLSEDYTLVMLAVYVLSIVGGAIWLRIGQHVDKHRINAICSVLVALTNLLMYVIVPGPHAFAQLIGIFSIAALCTSGAIAAQTALLADVSDYGTLTSGREHPGNYFALFAFTNKASLAIGSGMGLVIAGLFGFRSGGQNTALGMTGFFLAIIWIPLVLNLFSAVCSWLFPLDRHRQSIIVRRLGRHTSGHRIDPMPQDASS